MASEVQKIRQEIERLEAYPQSRGFIKHMIAFIDSLPEESSGEDLEEEIKKLDNWYPVEIRYIREIAHHFAEWQKQQIMKYAVENIVEDWCGDSPEITIPLNPQDFKTGDKVKIIVIKEEQ